MTLRVLHLVGSPVDDFHCALSRLYATDCLAATADPQRYEVHVAFVTPDRRWRFPDDLSDESIAAAPSMDVAAAVGHLVDLDVDVAVPQMFCGPGMTTYRALLDLLGIRYVGNAPEVMALTMDKARARAVVASAGVDVPHGELLGPGDRPTITTPAVVKPVDSDNSVGVGYVAAPTGYPDALDRAFEHSDRVLVEEFVELGREVRCGIVVEGGELVCLPLEEYGLDPRSAPIRGYGDKLASGDDGDLHLVAKEPTKAWIVDVEDPITEAVWAMARTCHSALGCRHYSLFDVRVDPGGRPWFLEAGLYCSFARKSVICTMAAATGVDTAELFRRSIRAVVD